MTEGSTQAALSSDSGIRGAITAAPAMKTRPRIKSATVVQAENGFTINKANETYGNDIHVALDAESMKVILDEYFKD